MPKKPRQTKARKRTWAAQKRKRILNAMHRDKEISKDVVDFVMHKPIRAFNKMLTDLKETIAKKKEERANDNKNSSVRDSEARRQEVASQNRRY